MPKYSVYVPVVGHMTLEVEAPTEEAALRIVETTWTDKNVDDFEPDWEAAEFEELEE